MASHQVSGLAEILCGPATIAGHPAGVAQRGVSEGKKLHGFTAELRMLENEVRQLGQMEGLAGIEGEPFLSSFKEEMDQMSASEATPRPSYPTGALLLVKSEQVS